MAEPSHRSLRSITLYDVRTGPPHEGELGEGVMLLTDRGDISAILHAFPEAQHRLDECAAALEQLLTQRIPTTLHAAGASAQEKPSC